MHDFKSNYIHHIEFIREYKEPLSFWYYILAIFVPMMLVLPLAIPVFVLIVLILPLIKHNMFIVRLHYPEGNSEVVTLTEKEYNTAIKSGKMDYPHEKHT
jgi:type IV secretory pathway component VirB8